MSRMSVIHVGVATGDAVGAAHTLCSTAGESSVGARDEGYIIPLPDGLVRYRA